MYRQPHQTPPCYTGSMRPFSDLPPLERLSLLTFKPCRPLRDAKEATQFAISRFHESWTAYHTITPTLYLITDDAPGSYLTLGQLRQKHGLSWPTLDATLAALESTRTLNGYLMAVRGVGGEPLRPLFTVYGHAWGEVHQGALDLSYYTPFEQAYTTELDHGQEAWQDLWREAATNANLPQHTR